MATSKKKMPDGGKINPKDAAVKKWMQEYVQSPKYKERLSNFYQYPDYIQGQRSKRIEGTQFQEVPGSTLQYSSGDNTLRISPTEIALKELNRQEVVAHELGHAINSNETNPALGLSPKEESYILNRSNLDSGTKQDVTTQAQKQEMGISRYMKISPSLHDFYPTENKSDIDTFRYLLNQQGIYNAGTQDITPEILQKAKQNPVINKSFSTQRLFENYQDNNLIDVMNKVAYNQNQPVQYAEFGGSLNFSSKPAYQRWLGYIHAKGLAESTPGNQKISINNKSHKVKHAYGGPIDSNLQTYNPYAVSNQLQNDTPYIPYSPVGSPLNQAMGNVNNYFATEQSNMIPNDASLQGPDPNQPEYLLDANTDQLSQSNYQPSSKAPNSQKGSKFKMPNMRFNTAGPILALAGLTGQMAQQTDFNDNQARRINRQFNQETYNPLPYGNGSQAIFKDGGEISPQKAREILHDGTIRGKKITDKQRKYFGAMSNKMANGGYMAGETYNLTPDEINLLSESGYSFDIIS